METLLAVVILIVLLAVSVVGILAFLRQMQITDLDNAAREIYYAAQNRAILLQGSQRLEKEVVREDGSNLLEDVQLQPEDEDATADVYYIRCDDEQIADLLPRETIEPSLWDGDFYIVYEPKSASVVDVFFGREALMEGGGNFKKDVYIWRTADRSRRMNCTPMIGYYGSLSGVGGSAEPFGDLIINIYDNENVLTAEVSYSVAQYLVASGQADTITLDVTLTYGGETISLDLEDAVGAEGIDADNLTKRTYTYTWVLDDPLGLSENGVDHFYELFDGTAGAEDMTFGGDFTIRARVSSTDPTMSPTENSGSGNSIFGHKAEGDGQNTARIRCLRHLQNLDGGISRVGDFITQAVQDGDVSGRPVNDEDETVNYRFLPIENEHLQSYNGGGFEIHSLTAGAQDENGAPVGDAGLFASISGTADAPTKTLTGIRLVNTTVAAGENGSAGALAGRAESVNITDCLVYWEATSEGSLEALLTQTIPGAEGEEDETVYLYQITGGVAGGLAGKMTDVTVTGSAAATLAEGGTAGGLAGTAENVIVETSYADCYLSGENAAGGLFGSANAVTVETAYAAGFITTTGNGGTAGAFWPGLPENPAIESAYAAVEINGGNTAYLLYDETGTETPANNAALTDKAEWEEALGDAFASKTAAQSHPYNLGGLALTTYQYPGLKDIDHYGDWSATFSAGTLVYYEQYVDGSYGFMGGNVNCLQNSRLPVSDGYAMVYEEDSAPVDALPVTYQIGPDTSDAGDWGKTTTGIAIDCTVAIDGEQTAITLLPLPAEAINVDYATEDFYQLVTVSDGELTYIYNPHFAMIPIESDGGELPDFGEPVSVRTPRHLYRLSCQEVYLGSDDPAGGYDFDFVQGRVLDYSVYTGPVTEDGQTFNAAAAPYLQSPIGTEETPFLGSYNGGSYRITGVMPDGGSGAVHVGLFGYNGGTLSNIVYEMSGAASVSAAGAGTARYLGGLAGTNAGTVNNCAVYGAEGVSFQAAASDSGVLYLGGLVGQNRGAIRRSAAEDVSLTASTNFASAWAGGLVGRNMTGARIVQCYAVGWLAASQGQGTDSLTIAGFSGDGGGAVQRSYAAVALENRRGEPVISGFSPAASENCFYLNNGNFIYRDEGIAFLYQKESSSGTEVNWNALTFTDMEGADTVGQALGMGQRNVDARGEDGASLGQYPFPAVVTDAAGKYVHYGRWPERLPMGGMGVFYWEALYATGANGKPTGAPSYHLSAIAADLGTGTVRKVGTLVTAHDDNRVVVEYGYGYYTLGGVDVTLQSENISWSRTGNSADFAFQPAYEYTAANTAFETLMGAEYKFHCYRTIDPESGDGLYRTAVVYRLGMQWDEDDGYGESTRPPAVNGATNLGTGIWTLGASYDNRSYSLSVELDPFFADALALNENAASGWNESSVSAETPGSSENAAYEIRSVGQLRFINWNAENKTTNTVLTASNNSQFPYLCGTAVRWEWNEVERNDGPWWWPEWVFDYWELQSTGRTESLNRSYFWLQTHDIHGGGGVYTPIAEFYDESGGDRTGTLSGWFGGTYDGDSYLIEDVNIQGGNSSCAGLFGAVFNGTLTDIILYSETGATVTSRDGENSSNWYGIGGLVGVAGSTDPNGAIQNCAVAGYTIVDRHTGGAGWGGTGLGGLAGICDMSLSGCTAVANIKVISGFNDNDNVRIGGLVGTCQGSITECYAGGTIDIDGGAKTGSDKGIYIGGIAGGVYMKPLAVAGSTDSVGRSGHDLTHTVTSCYTYVTLPALNANNYIRGLYAISGSGDLCTQQADTGNRFGDHGWVTHDNNYYLESLVLRNNQSRDNWQSQNNGQGTHDRPETDIGENGVASQTYEQMSSEAFVGQLGGAYAPVTALNGRYSFPSPDPMTGDNNMDRFSGLDYPFPAILRQESELTADGSDAYVHYGWWPLRGIVRDAGSGPIQLDVFADAAGAPYTETLSLSADLGTPTGGHWSVTGQGGVVEANVSPENGASTTLTVTPLQPGETTLTVSCEGYDAVTIHVVVTAELSLQPMAPVALFPGESLSGIALQWVNGAGDPISDTQAAGIAVQGAFNAARGDLLTSAIVIRDAMTGAPTLSVTAGNQSSEDASVTVSFRFTYNGSAEQSGSAVIPVTILEAALDTPEVTLTGATGTYEVTGVTADGQPITDVDVQSVRSAAAGLTVTRQNNILTFSAADLADGDYTVWVTVEFTYGGEDRTAVLPLTVQVQR